jgi:hypothetical protein
MLARGSSGPSWRLVKLWEVGAVVVVFATMAVIFASLRQAPIYEAQAQVRSSEASAGAIEDRAVAEETIERLGGFARVKTSPAEMLENLTVKRSEDVYFTLTYEDTDPKRAQIAVNTVGKVSGELVRPASSPLTPVSPHPWRNGLITLVVGLVLVGVAKLATARRTT